MTKNFTVLVRFQDEIPLLERIGGSWPKFTCKYTITLSDNSCIPFCIKCVVIQRKCVHFKRERWTEYEQVSTCEHIHPCPGKNASSFTFTYEQMKTYTRYYQRTFCIHVLQVGVTLLFDEAMHSLILEKVRKNTP